MALTHFRLRKKTPINKPAIVYLMQTFVNPRYCFAYPLNLKIEPRYWNFKQERMKEIPEAKNCKRINTFLNDLYTSIEKYRFDLTLNRKNLTLDRLKIHLKEYFKEELNDDPDKITLFRFIEKFIKESKTRVNINTGKTISDKTPQRHNAIK